ncbi:MULTISPECIES: acetate kinase [Helcobacillus]|uniref:Acetate kinase n=1 Tax=Helcobacillus massiliensis TaxID=521392 RepID=A0A839R056_9MICO|nr:MULTISPECIES: acetate kinase [Helcobacillus]MBB3023067.1 acetate kinase [Helcobacillus massiliensis]MCG7426080.1 acetate kinase [Helcobacillus sp. ACRRO]
MTSTILVINSGSSSIKFELVDPVSEHTTAVGIVERVGQRNGTARIEADGRTETYEGPVPNHVAGMEVIQNLFAKMGVELNESTVRAVGHRVVQGGAQFAEPTLIDDEVRGAIYALGALAPLHNYPAVDGIDGAKALLPSIPHVAVFDTAFFTALPDSAATYALNKEVAEEHRIRRYGAHGTSHRFISERVPQFLREQDLLEGADGPLRQIVLHLGNGASASAVVDGAPVDTSMGLTPLEGLVMGTRSGDVDASVYVHLHRRAGMSPTEVDTLLNKKSGLVGMLGYSDFRDLEAALDAGDEDAQRAFAVWAHRVRKYVGSYAFVMGGVDIIAFTAGIGENADFARAEALKGLEAFGIEVDPQRNAGRVKEPRIISTDDSAVTVVVYPTNEELAIAQQTLSLVEG